MNIIMSLHKQWAEKIFDGSKPFEFRTKLPNNFAIGDKVFVYETRANNGRGLVIGYFTVKNIIKLSHALYGCYDFIEYYYKNIAKQPNTAKAFRKIKEEFVKEKYPNLKLGAGLDYTFSPEDIENFQKYKKPINFWNFIKEGEIPTDVYTISQKVSKNRNRASNCMIECDNWLSNIGFYDDYDESNWNYAIEIGKVVLFKEPRDINNFVSKDNKAITRAPQSWMYTNNDMTETIST